MATPLHLEFEPRLDESLDIRIVPENSKYANQLQLHLGFFNIKNPCADFSRHMKSGDYDGIPEFKLAQIAEICNVIGDCWILPDDVDETGAPILRAEMNAVMLVEQLIRLIIKLNPKQHPTVNLHLDCNETSCYLQPINKSDKRYLDSINLAIKRPYDDPRLSKVCELLWHENDDDYQDFFEIFMRAIKELSERL